MTFVPSSAPQNHVLHCCPDMHIVGRGCFDRFVSDTCFSTRLAENCSPLATNPDSSLILTVNLRIVGCQLSTVRTWDYNCHASSCAFHLKLRRRGNLSGNEFISW